MKYEDTLSREELRATAFRDGFTDAWYSNRGALDIQNYKNTRAQSRIAFLESALAKAHEREKRLLDLLDEALGLIR